MKKLSLIALAALLCSGLALTAWKGGNKADADDYIAKTIFDLIPREDLPDYCAHVQQTDYSDYDPADVPEFDPTFFAAGIVEGHNVEGMDSGFYGYINVKCYPLKDGGWRAYWAAYGGYDGLCGFDRGGAYNYVKGKLTKEEFWLLPNPPIDEILSADLRDELDMAGEYEQLSYPHPNYSYRFGSGEDGLLSVNLDLDYLFYGEENDGAYSGTTYDVDYGWNGQRLVRQDFDDLDDVQMRALALMLGINLEEAVETYHGFDSDNVYMRIYAGYDELGFPSSWLVFSYTVDKRDLKVYSFDGNKLEPTEHMIVKDWNALKTGNETAGLWMSTEAIRFFGVGEDEFDFPLGGYTYDSSCEGLFEPDDLFEE